MPTCESLPGSARQFWHLHCVAPSSSAPPEPARWDVHAFAVSRLPQASGTALLSRFKPACRNLCDRWSQTSVRRTLSGPRTFRDPSRPEDRLLSLPRRNPARSPLLPSHDRGSGLRFRLLRVYGNCEHTGVGLHVCKFDRSESHRPGTCVSSHCQARACPPPRCHAPTEGTPVATSLLQTLSGRAPVSPAHSTGTL